MNGEPGEIGMQAHVDAASGKLPDNVIQFPNAVDRTQFANDARRDLNQEQSGFASRLRSLLAERFGHHEEPAQAASEPQPLTPRPVEPVYRGDPPASNRPPSGKAF